MRRRHNTRRWKRQSDKLTDARYTKGAQLGALGSLGYRNGSAYSQLPIRSP